MTTHAFPFNPSRPPGASTVVLFVAMLLGPTLALHATTWNVADAGAIGDGQTDATEVFQKTLNAAGGAGGGVVEVPAGRYRINGHLVVPANVTLQGIHRVAPTTGPNVLTNLAGSVLLAYAGRGSSNETPFIRLAGRHATIAGLVIAYPEWRQTDVPPVPYPPCVASQDTENVGVLDCLLLNPYEAIRFVRAHRHLVRNVNGYPIWRGLFVDECYDIGRVENVHFWPFGVNYDPKDPFCEWVNTQGTAFEFARTDWHYVVNTFCFGYGVGYKFSQSPHGSANGNFLGIGADSCQRAVVVEQAQPPGVLITNGEFVGRWSSTDAVCLEIGPDAEGKVSLVNCSFWGPIDRCVWMRSATGQFTASACNFVHWDNRGVGSPALQLDAGKALVQGCTFAQDNLHVQVGSNVVSAILTANQAAGGFRVENAAGRRAQIALNEAEAVEWTAEAKLHYRLHVGGVGDGRYLQGWQGPERGDRPFRWSTAASKLVLPVVPGRDYRLTIEANVPKAAESADSGVYFEGRCLAPLRSGSPVTVTLPSVVGERVRLELRCRGWVPTKELARSQDGRTLGIQAFAVTMRAEGAEERIFDANSGRWSKDAR